MGSEELTATYLEDKDVKSALVESGLKIISYRTLDRIEEASEQTCDYTGMYFAAAKKNTVADKKE